MYNNRLYQLPGQATFLEIHPAPALPAHALPTLGSFATTSNPSSSTTTRRPAAHAHQRTSTAPKPPSALTLSAATFIDYGVFSSLAPPFDSDGGCVSRETLGLVSAFKASRKKKRNDARTDVQTALKELAAKKFPVDVASGSSMDIDGGAGAVEEEDHQFSSYSSSRVTIASLASSVLGNDHATLQGVFTALDASALEEAVDELLARNSRALHRMQGLQAIRYRAGASTGAKGRVGAGTEHAVVQGSEEWVLGREVLASLVTLVGLRPRVVIDPSLESTTSLSTSASATLSASSPLSSSSATLSSSANPPSNHTSSTSLIPRPTLLHTLARSVPQTPTPGYKGTLSSTRDFALIDNTTIRPSAAALAMPPPPIAGSQSASSSSAQGGGLTLPPAPSVGVGAGGYHPHSQYTPRPGATSYGYAGRGGAGAGGGAGSGATTPARAVANTNYYPASAYYSSASSSSHPHPQTPTPMNGAGGGYYAHTPASPSPYSAASSGGAGTGGRAVPNLAGKPNGVSSSAWSSPASGTGTGGIPGGMALPPHLRGAARPPPVSSPYSHGYQSSPAMPHYQHAYQPAVGAGMAGVMKAGAGGGVHHAQNGSGTGTGAGTGAGAGTPTPTWGSVTPLR